jgi:hypothetical protein
MNRSISKTFIAGVLLAGAACAQKSPPREADISLGGSKISIKYGAPSVRGRKIFGGLVPYGQPWRLGANSATSLSTERDLQIGSLKVPKGNYTLYMLPGESESLLIVNKQTGQWGTEYNAGQDLGRVKLTRTPKSPPVEQFTIKFEAKGSDSATLSFTWDNSEFSVPVT